MFCVENESSSLLHTQTKTLVHNARARDSTRSRSGEREREKKRTTTRSFSFCEKRRRRPRRRRRRTFWYRVGGVVCLSPICAGENWKKSFRNPFTKKTRAHVVRAIPRVRVEGWKKLGGRPGPAMRTHAHRAAAGFDWRARRTMCTCST